MLRKDFCTLSSGSNLSESVAEKSIDERVVFGDCVEPEWAR